MKIVTIYLNFVFHIQVKTKSKNKILNFVFQFIKNTKWNLQVVIQSKDLMFKRLYSTICYGGKSIINSTGNPWNYFQTICQSHDLY